MVPHVPGTRLSPGRAPVRSFRGRLPWYARAMSMLHARVKGGQIVVEGKTDLPEGDELLARVREPC